jgi:hypothetical protein
MTSHRCKSSVLQTLTPRFFNPVVSQAQKMGRAFR